MSNLSLQELIFLFKIITYFIGIIGGIIVFSISAIGFFFRSDRKRNYTEHQNLFAKTDDNGERIAKIEGKLKL